MKIGLSLLALALIVLDVTATGVSATGPCAVCGDGAIDCSLKKGITKLVDEQDNVEGSWQGTQGTCSYKNSSTALAVLVLELEATKQGLDPLDPVSFEYAEQVQRGLDFILENRDVEVGVLRYDGNDNRTGAFYQDCNKVTYASSVCLMAIAASNHPEKTAPIDGTYGGVAQDILDYLAWTQKYNDSRCTNLIHVGGWGIADRGYNCGWSDIYHTGNASLALGYALKMGPLGLSSTFGLQDPVELDPLGNPTGGASVTDRLDGWIDKVICDDPYQQKDGGAGWWPGAKCSRVNTQKTGNLLYAMALAGDPVTSERAMDAIQYIETHWNDDGCTTGWRNFPPAMFSVMNGLDAMGIELLTVDGETFDWYQEFADHLIETQKDDGSWTENCGYESQSTAYALLTLNRPLHSPARRDRRLLGSTPTPTQPDPIPLGDSITVADECEAYDSSAWELKLDGVKVTDLVVGQPYAPPSVGVYELCLTCLCAGNEECTLLAVYDSSEGFVTGGGHFSSPSGAMPEPNDQVTGKANFGFVSKYQKNGDVPIGQTEFNFKAGGLTFHSSAYEWLVVTGSDFAKFKGTGSVNQDGEYKFMVWAGDGTGLNGEDTFRVKIWVEDSGGQEDVTYDNGSDQPIDGGNIKIHRKRVPCGILTEPNDDDLPLAIDHDCYLTGDIHCETMNKAVGNLCIGITTGVTFDCDGHSIIGPGANVWAGGLHTNTNGIGVLGITGGLTARIKNCQIHDFDTGIHISDTNDDHSNPPQPIFINDWYACAIAGTSMSECPNPGCTAAGYPDDLQCCPGRDDIDGLTQVNNCEVSNCNFGVMVTRSNLELKKVTVNNNMHGLQLQICSKVFLNDVTACYNGMIDIHQNNGWSNTCYVTAAAGIITADIMSSNANQVKDCPNTEALINSLLGEDEVVGCSRRYLRK